MKRSFDLKQERSVFTSMWTFLPCPCNLRLNFTQILDRVSMHLFHASQFGLQRILVPCILVKSLGYQRFFLLSKTHLVSREIVCFTVNSIRSLFIIIKQYFHRVHGLSIGICIHHITIVIASTQIKIQCTHDNYSQFFGI